MFALRVIVADEDAASRKKICNIVEMLGNIDLCEQVEDGADAIARSKAIDPDIAILSTGLPVISGLEVAKELRGLYPHIAILMLTPAQGEHFALSARLIGANGYVAKPASAETILSAMDAALHEGAVR